MKRKTLTILVMFILLLTAVFGNLTLAADAASSELSINTASAEKGDTVYVTMKYTGTMFGAAEGSIAYDSNKVKFTSYSGTSDASVIAADSSGKVKFSIVGTGKNSVYIKAAFSVTGSSGSAKFTGTTDILADETGKEIAKPASQSKTLTISGGSGGETDIPAVKINQVKTNYGKVRVIVEPVDVSGVKYEVYYRETDLGADAAYKSFITDETSILIDELRTNVKYTVKVRAVKDGKSGSFSSLAWGITNPSGEYELPDAQIAELLSNYGKIRIKTDLEQVNGNVGVEVYYREYESNISDFKMVRGGDNILLEGLENNTKYIVKTRYYIEDIKGETCYSGFSVEQKRVATPSGDYTLPKAEAKEILVNTGKVRVKTDLANIAGDVKVQVKYKKTSEPSSSYRLINGGDNILIENLAQKTQYTVKIRYYIKDIDGVPVFGSYSNLYHVVTK